MTRVHILASCRNPDLIAGSLLVFKTLRTGFPKADVSVWINGGSHREQDIQRAAEEADAENVVHLNHETTHGKWIERLCNSEMEPFWICDTDIVFWKSMEGFRFPEGMPIAGAHTPVFQDKLTLCYTRARLHPSLMWIDPMAVMDRLAEFMLNVPKTPFNPLINLFSAVMIPPCEFYDTLALLFRAIGGGQFSDEHKACYDHLLAGTYSDLAGKAYDAPSLPELHKAIYREPTLAKHMWHEHDRFYANHRP